MRILFVIESLDIGGAEVHLCRVLPRLALCGLEPCVFVMRGRGALAGKLEAADIEVVSVDIRPLDRAGRRGRGRAWRGMAGAFLRLARLVRERQPSVVHYFLPGAYLLGYPAARLAGARIHVLSRRSLNLYQRKARWVAFLERRFHRGMSAVTGNSKAVLQELEDEGVNPRRLHLIYNGVDELGDPSPDVQARVRSQHDLGRGELVLTMVSNLIPYKGHADLIEALARISLTQATEWRLMLVGRDDGIGASLMSLARRHGLQDRVIRLGLRSDVAEILLASDIGVHCSHQEGFSNAILEGMAAGLPMVVTDVGGNAEAVAHGITGLVVPAREPAALAQALEQLMLDRALRQRMGEAGARRVRECFSLDACVAGYVSLYSALGRHAGPGTAR